MSEPHSSPELDELRQTLVALRAQLESGTPWRDDALDELQQALKKARERHLRLYEGSPPTSAFAEQMQRDPVRYAPTDLTALGTWLRVPAPSTLSGREDVAAGRSPGRPQMQPAAELPAPVHASSRAG